MRKGQSGVMDAMMFMIITSGAVGMLLFVSGLYAESTNQQVLSSYSYEYAGNALVALHYARDDKGDWFWRKLAEKYDSEHPDELEEYLEGDAGNVVEKVRLSSPSPQTYLCVLDSSVNPLKAMCYSMTPDDVGVLQTDYDNPNPCGPGMQSYSYAVPLDGVKSVSVILCY